MKTHLGQESERSAARKPPAGAEGFSRPEAGGEASAFIRRARVPVKTILLILICLTLAVSGVTLSEYITTARGETNVGGTGLAYTVTEAGTGTLGMSFDVPTTTRIFGDGEFDSCVAAKDIAIVNDGGIAFTVEAALTQVAEGGFCWYVVPGSLTSGYAEAIAAELTLKGIDAQSSEADMAAALNEINTENLASFGEESLLGLGEDSSQARLTVVVWKEHTSDSWTGEELTQQLTLTVTAEQRELR